MAEIVDAYGREFRIRARTFHEAAVPSSRRFRGMMSSGASATTAIIQNAFTLRNRSRDLLRNNAWAFGGIESLVANCIGTGIKPQSRALDENFRNQIHELWNDWIGESDADGLTNFYGQQSLLAWTMYESGECFARLRVRRLDDGLVVPFQIQLLEPDHVPLDRQLPLQNGNTMRAGIEFDGLGRRVAYHMFRSHPGDQFSAALSGDTVRVPASAAIHCFRATRPGQLRGYPHLIRVLLRLLNIDEADDAELMKKKVQSLFTGFVQTADDEPRIFGEGAADSIADQDDAIIDTGTMQYLRPGESVDFSSPPSIPNNHGEFMRYHLHGVSAGMGLTYEQLTSDLSQVNFSSIRAGLNEFYRRCESFIHQVIVHQFCRPVWRRFVTEAVLSGKVAAPGFATDPRMWLRADWIPQGWDYVNPLQEVKADILAIRAGLTTRSRVIARQGDDPEQIDREREAEERRAEQLGLEFDFSGA